MNNELQTFTTDSSPGEQEFEQTASDATAHIVELLSAESGYWGPRMHITVRTGVRDALRENGSATAEDVERVIENGEPNEGVGPINQTDVLELFDNTLREDGENGVSSQ